MSKPDSLPTKVANKRTRLLEYVSFVEGNLDKVLIAWAQGRYTRAENLLKTSLSFTEFEEFHNH